MITTGSVYNRADREPPEFRVLVMRQWPRGIRKTDVDVWLKDAGPSRELLARYNRGEIGWEDFERSYRHEIAHQRPWVVDEIRGLEQAHGTVRILCFERIPPREHCHREVLMELLAST